MYSYCLKFHDTSSVCGAVVERQYYNVLVYIGFEFDSLKGHCFFSFFLFIFFDWLFILVLPGCA